MLDGLFEHPALPVVGDITIPSQHSLPLVILGAGYTGTFLYHQAVKQGWKAFATSRFPGTHLSYVEPPSRILFDLEQPDTWGNIPTPAHIIWCFPAIPENLASTFAKDIANKESRILLLGSTSAFPANPDELTDERAKLNMALPRVQSEEHLRKTYGVIILRLAGLYGPGRHVLNWIRRGKIKNTGRYVNLIHVEDAAALCLAALDQAESGSSYIVADGTPRLWADICQFAATQWNIPIPEPTVPKDLGKRLSSQKVLKELNYELKHPNLFEELNKIEANGEGTMNTESVIRET